MCEFGIELDRLLDRSAFLQRLKLPLPSSDPTCLSDEEIDVMLHPKWYKKEHCAKIKQSMANRGVDINGLYRSIAHLPVDMLSWYTYQACLTATAWWQNIPIHRLYIGIMMNQCSKRCVMCDKVFLRNRYLDERCCIPCAKKLGVCLTATDAVEQLRVLFQESELKIGENQTLPIGSRAASSLLRDVFCPVKRVDWKNHTYFDRKSLVEFLCQQAREMAQRVEKFQKKRTAPSKPASMKKKRKVAQKPQDSQD